MPSKSNLNAASISANFNAPLGELPSLLVTQTLPWLSIGETAGGVSHLEGFKFAGVGSGETDHVVGDGIGDPDAVLLINGESERPDQFAGVLQRIARLVLAEELRPWTDRPAEASRSGL